LAEEVDAAREAVRDDLEASHDELFG
jgi:hypothetical protein